MKMMIRAFAFLFVLSLLTACSSTEMTGSWSNPEFKGQINKVYMIGSAKNAMNRRLFEDTFNQELVSLGVQALSSYRDFPDTVKVDKEAITGKMIEYGCDSVLVTKLIGKRTETVTNPGRVSGYSSGPYYGRGGGGGYYGSWDRYYSRSTEVVYTPPTTTEFVIVTVESVLYDLKTEEMIWSAHSETTVEGDIGKMMQDYVKAVTKDLQDKGLVPSK